MTHQPQIIAGRPMVRCPDCNAPVRDDLLSDHANRCPARLAAPPATSAPVRATPARPAAPFVPVSRAETVAPRADAPPAGRRMPVPRIAPAPTRQPAPKPGFTRCGKCGMDVPAAHLVAHKQRCEKPKAAMARTTDRVEQPKPVKRTEDGYEIATCWGCNKRVCLVPSRNGFCAYAIDPDTRCGRKHTCVGERTGGRRSQLVYVNSQLGSLVPSDEKRRRM